VRISIHYVRLNTVDKFYYPSDNPDLITDIKFMLLILLAILHIQKHKKRKSGCSALLGKAGFSLFNNLGKQSAKKRALPKLFILLLPDRAEIHNPHKIII